MREMSHSVMMADFFSAGLPLFESKLYKLRLCVSITVLLVTSLLFLVTYKSKFAWYYLGPLE
jgi:hypothetical protein